MPTPVSESTLKSPIFPTWCPGCGDFGIWSAIKKALTELAIPEEQLVIVFGVGCSGNMADFIRCYGFHALHGRALPVAQSIKLANHGLKILVVAGDGDTYGEGMGHFIASCRGNHDVTLLVHDNEVYGLTTGQAAPTTEKGRKTKSTPTGIIEAPINPIATAVSAGATWVGRGFAGNIPFTTDLVKKALLHKGFSVLDVFQPCVTFNKVNTHLWYNERVKPIESATPNTDKLTAIKWSMESQTLPIGVFYEDTTQAAYHEQVSALQEKTLVSQSIETVSLKTSLQKYM